MRRQAISAVELVVAAVVLVVVALLTVPRLGEAADPPARPPVKHELEVLRNAIERYCYDHVAWPAQRSDGVNEAGSAAALVRQLTAYTDRDGIANDQPSTRFCLGPYLNELPACPLRDADDDVSVCVIDGDTAPGFTAPRPSAHWVYNCQTGEIAANSDAVDPGGTRYDRY